MDRPGYASVDDYIAAQPAPARPVLERVRATIREALPGAVEGISYQIPIYKLGGRMVLYFAGFQRHYSIYPATERVVAALGRELAGALHSKATIRLSFAHPVPTRLIGRIAKLRAAEVAELEAAKAGRKAGPPKAPAAKARRAAEAAARKAAPTRAAARKATGRKPDPDARRAPAKGRAKKRRGPVGRSPRFAR